MSYDYRIVLLNLKKYRKSYLFLSTVIILACIFVFFITIFNDSRTKTEEQQRKELYGSWHVAFYDAKKSLLEDLDTHATIEAVGKMTGYGYVLNQDHKSEGIIGSVDENLCGMGLSFLCGELPAKEDEIAVEMSYLCDQGYSYELGQKITLKIQTTDSQTGKTKELDKTYTLTGILRNYSSLWKSEGQPLISYFVKDGDLSSAPLFEHAFCTLKKKYVKNGEELSLLTRDRGVFLVNDYTYYNYAVKSDPDSLFLSESLLITLVLFTSAFFIINVFNTSLKEHNRSFVVMRCLGAGKGQMTMLYFKELLLVLSVTFTVGMFLGFCVSYLGYFILRNYIRLLFYVDARKLALIMAVIISLVLIFAVFTVLRIRSVPLAGNVILQPEKIRIGKRRRKLKPLTIRRMVRIFNSAHKREAVVYFLLTLGTFMVISVTSYSSYKKYGDYVFIKNAYPADYECGTMLSYYEPNIHVNESEVSQVRKLYGIDYVRAYKCSGYLPLKWGRINDSDYAQLLSKNYFSQFANKEGVFATVFGISDDARDYQFYFNEVDEGKVNYDDFFRGNEVIIYLPVYYKTKNDEVFGSTDDVKNLYSASNTFKESTITVGDELQIEGEKGKVSVKVGGIIYDFGNKDAQSFLSKPYSIICNYEMYDKFVSKKNYSTYEFLQIYTNKNVNYERTNAELSKVIKKFNPENYKLEKENAKNAVMINVFISFLLDFIAIFITIVIQYSDQTSKLEMDYTRNNILNMLGMQTRKIHLIYLYSICINCIVSIFLVFLAVFIYITLFYYFTTILTLKQTDVFNMIKQFYRIYFNSINWAYVGLLILGFLIMNLFISYYPIIKYRKIKD